MVERLQRGSVVKEIPTAPTPPANDVKYFLLIAKYPELATTIIALQKMQESQGNKLTQKDQEALLIYSLWHENPNRMNEISSIFGISREITQERVDSVIFNRDDEWDRLLREKQKLEKIKSGGPFAQYLPVDVLKGMLSQNHSALQVSCILMRVLEDCQEITRTIAALVFAGKSNNEIMRELSISQKKFKKELASARSTIKQRLLDPLGLRPISEKNTIEKMELRKAAALGNLRAIKVLRMWHTTDALIDSYKAKKRHVDEKLVSQGYLSLVQHATPSEYIAAAFSRKISYVKRDNGTLYIKPEDLERLKKSLRKRTK